MAVRSRIGTLKYLFVMFSRPCAFCNLCFAFRSVMLFFRCSLILSTFFSAFSRSSFRSIPSSTKYSFRDLPNTFVVGTPYWSRRMWPIFEGALLSARVWIVSFSCFSVILTQVGFANSAMINGGDFGF